ncbi:MAG: disulfide bond formation protein DsbA [Actinobacteria bacterium]|nr:MAG: disulfide bond formation protein DsbA [Actinomycetota bacterium]
MNIEIWIDPACPFCWTTAKWVVEDVQPKRDINITWRPISLFFKNSPEPDSPYYEASVFTHGLLRVMESVRTTDGNEGVFKLYWEVGARIHHDETTTFDPLEALVAAGLDKSHVDAFEDETWDALIRSSMDEALELAGDDVGTPIIAATNSDGVRNGYFGPVISHAPELEAGLAMWDGLMAMMNVDSFFELKRTRTDAPDPGERPNLRS